MKVKASNQLYIGIMSGTSLDAIDLALVDFQAIAAGQLVASLSYPFPKLLREYLQQLVTEQHASLTYIGQLHASLGKTYATAVSKLIGEVELEPENINAIGCHGQTICHEPHGPNAFSWQLGDAHRIATMTGITTVADFRNRDIALGGQGAPLAPAYHKVAFVDNKSGNTAKIILNIGGIANITYLPSENEAEQKIIGFDTGPGNTLMDSWVQTNLNKNFDADGNLAASGTVNQQLLDSLLSEEYFNLPYPKSTGRELFNLEWLKQHIKKFEIKDLATNDMQATLCELTAISISDAIQKVILDAKTMASNIEIIVCGGGANNKYLLQRLEKNLRARKSSKAHSIVNSSNYGIDPNYLEAIAFAYFAKCAIDDIALDMTNITGASKSAVLGVIHR